MIPDKIRDAFNEQIMHETFSAYLYLSMVAYFQAEGYDGMATWMRAQAMEEMTHAMKFFDHINERGGEVELLEIKKPQFRWKSPLDAFKAALEHERFISGRINELMKLADGEKDFASKSLLQWFVDEQVEEEDNAGRNVQNLEMIGDSGHGLLMIDREMSARTFNFAALEGGGDGE
jgi:ferritin